MIFTAVRSIVRGIGAIWSGLIMLLLIGFGAYLGWRARDYVGWIPWSVDQELDALQLGLELAGASPIW